MHKMITFYTTDQLRIGFQQQKNFELYSRLFNPLMDDVPKWPDTL